MSFKQNQRHDSSLTIEPLFLLVPPQIAPFDFGETPLNAGEFLQVMCTAKEGDLPIKLHWTLNGKPLNLTSDLSVSPVGKRGSTLSIEAISHAHVGTFTCFAENLAGKTSFSSELRVNGSTKF